MGIEAQRAIELGQELAWAQKRRLHRSINYRDYVFAWSKRFSFGLFVSGFVGFMGITIFLELSGIQMGTIIDKVFVSMAMGVACGGVGLSWGLWVRATQFDLLMEWEQEEVEFASDVQQPPIERTAIWRSGNQQEERIIVRNPKTIEHAGKRFTFTGSQLDRLLIWYEEGHTRARRDSSQEGPGWVDLPDGGIRSDRYSEATWILKRQGLLDSQNEWTALGENFLKEL